MAEVAEGENAPLKELHAFREQFQTKYNRRMADEEKRILDSEKLLKSRAAKKQGTGKSPSRSGSVLLLNIKVNICFCPVLADVLAVELHF